MKKTFRALAFSFLLLSSHSFAVGQSPSTKRLLTTDGEKVAYQILGKPGAPTIVFLHGFPFSSQMWTSQIESLKKDYRIIAMDLRGAGQSKTVKNPFTMEMLVDDLFLLLETEKVNKPIVVGFSMGGFLALRALEREPTRFGALVLADTKSNADSNDSKLRRTEAIKTVREKGIGPYADIFLKSAVAPSAKPEISKKLKDLILKETSVQGITFSIFALMSRTDTTASLPHIKIPTLIIVGDSDTVTNLASAQDLQKGITGSQLKIIPEAGHITPIENSSAFNEAITNFLKGTHL